MTMGAEPVFRNRYEIDIWRKLTSASWRSEDAFNVWIGNLLERNETLDPHILVRAMGLAVEHDPDRCKDTVHRLVSRCRPSDSLPLFAAAGIFLDAGDADAAKETLSKARRGNLPVRHCMAARVALMENDPERAGAELSIAYCGDPAFPMIYDLAEELDPAGDWIHMRNIALIASGRNPIDNDAVDADSALGRLYGIYRSWSGGRRDEATDLLSSSAEFLAGDADFLLASARMSVDERDWHSAKDMYRRVLEARPDCAYIVRESAEAHFRGKDYERALELYRVAESIDPRSEETAWGLVHAYRACGMTAEAVQCAIGFLDTEDADMRSYKKCARLLHEWGYNDEALKVVHRMKINHPRDMEIGLLHSMIMMGKGQPNEALNIVKEVLHRNPDSVECRIQYADVLMRMGRLDRARKEVDRLLKADPADLRGLEFLLDLTLVQGDPEETISVCKRILEQEPMNRRVSGVLANTQVTIRSGRNGTTTRSLARSFADPTDLLDLAVTLMSDGRAEEVLDVCDEYERRFKADSRIKLLRGNAEYASGEYLRASAAYAAAAEADPTDPIAWHSKGMADEKLGDLDSAEEAFNRAVLIDLNESEFWVSRSVIQELKGDLSGAVESLNRVIELTPEASYALVRKGMILASMGRFDEALYFVKLAAVTDGSDTDILRVERDIHALASRTESSIGLSERILELDPEDSETVGFLAAAYISKGDRASAIAIVGKAVLDNPRSIPMLLEKKTVMERIGDFRAAISVCEGILDIQPDNRLVKADLAGLYENIGDREAADRLHAEMRSDEEMAALLRGRHAAVSRESGESSYQIAKSLLAAGDLQSSARMAERALASDPGDPRYVLLRSEIYAEAGDPRGAYTFLSEAIREGADAPAVHAAAGDLRAAADDHLGAVVHYRAALRLGADPFRTIVRMGEEYEKAEDYDSALDCFRQASRREPQNMVVRRHMVVCLLATGGIEEAVRNMDALYAVDRSAGTLALRTVMFAEMRDTDSVRVTYGQYARCDDRVPETDQMVIMAMDSVGLGRLHRRLSEAGASAREGPEVSDRVKRYAERILRKAYISGMALNDPDLATSLDMDPETAGTVLGYLSDISAYGDILPNTPEFERMEGLSVNAVVKGDCTGLSEDPVISLPCAYVAGRTRDADEAKRLVAYIYEAMTSEADAQTAESIGKVPAGIDGDTPVEEIVRRMGIGVYRARALKGRL